MTWFTASIITAIKVEDKNQTNIPVYEDFYLIEADSRDIALQKAKCIGLEIESMDDTLTLNNRPAKRIFAGVRKLRSVYNDEFGDIDSKNPSHGTELTHSYYEAVSWESVKRLAEGQRVNIDYVDNAESI